MKILFPIAVGVLALVQAPLKTETTAGPLPHEHWQRMLVLPAGHPAVEQCVVLDAELFAMAAPGLRDVRLLQGERELPYAVDESHDDRETGSSVPVDDRSIFDTIGIASLKAVGGVQHVAAFLLPAHVPVERISLLGALAAPVSVVVRATPGAPFAGSLEVREAEVVRLQAAPGALSLPVTLGANLQQMAGVEVAVRDAPPTLTGVALEMRRRELCYQPITDAPVRMVYGDPEARLTHYDYALHYTPTATPVLATMGPREINPAYEAPAQQVFEFTAKEKLGVAIGLCAGMLVVTLGVLLKFRR